MQGAVPGQTQGPIPGQTAHLSEEQKRMLLMKQKVLNQSMPYGAMQPHAQVRCHLGSGRCFGYVVWLFVVCVALFLCIDGKNGPNVVVLTLTTKLFILM